MAYTKIHAIKATVDKAIDYICNPEKTYEKMFVSSYACSPETAAYDFKYTLDHCRENSPNKAYHLIQAFAPGEVGFEEAHRIGKELADKLLEGKFSYVVTTHIDKGHVHNHIIFCAADNIEHNKYHDCKQSYYRIRKLSDELCKEHNLSVIIPGAQRGRKYKEWQSEQNGSAWIRFGFTKKRVLPEPEPPITRMFLFLAYFGSFGLPDIISRSVCVRRTLLLSNTESIYCSMSLAFPHLVGSFYSQS